jgi:hypothetical protein
MKRAALVVGLILGVYLIGRAVAEPFVIDFADPGTYRDDWGGPTLAGVLAVHSGPGVIAAAVIAVVLLRRRSARRQQAQGARDASRP